MKINIKQIANLSAWAFSLLLSTGISAQSVSKTFTITEDIPEGSTITTQDAFDICVDASGYINAHTTKDQKYQIWASDYNQPTLEIDRNVLIETSDWSVFTQNITVTIEADIPGEAQRMMDALSGMAFKTSKGHYGFDALLGIKTVKVVNGFWRIDKEAFELENGQSFYVKSVRIQTALVVPKNANLVLDADYTNFKIDQLDGDVELAMKSCQLVANSINDLTGRVAFSQIDIQNMRDGEVRAKKSNFDIKNANHFEIGLSELARQNLLAQRRSTMNCMILNRINSDLNEYTFDNINLLEVKYSSSDAFNIGTIQNLEVDDAVFSNFEIDMLNQRLWANCKNGDIEVQAVGEAFEQIEVNNEVSEVQFGLTNLPAYTIHLTNDERMEALLPTKVKLLDTKSLMDKTYQKGNDPNAPKVNIICDQCKVKIKD